MAFRKRFPKHYTHSNIQLNIVCALWKYSGWWASSRSNAFRRSFSKHYAHSNIQLNKVCDLWKYSKWWASGTSNGFQKKSLKHYTYSNIQLNKVCTLWRYTEWWTSSRSNSFQKKIFKNNLHIQTYNCTKYALCRSTLSGGLQAEAMAFRIFFSKQYKHSNIQLNKVWDLWNYSEWWASSSSNGFQRKFLKTLYTFKYTFEQCMRSVKVHWLVGFKQKQCLSEEVFQKLFTHSNIQLQEVCAL